MQPSSLKTIAFIIGIGSLLFLVAAFLPYSKVFVEHDPEKRMAIITEMKRMWNIANIFFILGAIITVIGLTLFLFGFKEIVSTRLSYLNIILFIVGAALWSWVITERIISPEKFANGTNTPYLFVIYSILMQVGLFLFGFLLLKTNLVNWVSWMLMLGSSTIFILMIIFKDMPPFVYYLLTLTLAVVMIFE